MLKQIWFDTENKALKAENQTVAYLLEFASLELDPEEPTPCPKETKTVELNRKPTVTELADIKAEAGSQNLKLMFLTPVGNTDEF